MIENLDDLRHEILRSVAASGIALFHAQPGALETYSLVHWDVDNHPDFADFLAAAVKAGARVMMVSRRVFADRDLEDALEDATDVMLSREERREVENGLRDMQRHIGATSAVEAAFEAGGVMYIFSALAAWFDEFLRITDLLDAASGDDEAGPLPGLYSNN